MIRINTGAPLPPGADAVVMVEETRLVEATEEGEEVKVEILAKVTLVLLMVTLMEILVVILVILLMVILMESSRRWRWVKTSDQWAATSERGRSSWDGGLSWDPERSVPFLSFLSFCLLLTWDLDRLVLFLQGHVSPSS